MSANIYQIYVDFPITTNQSTDLMYFGRLPYSNVSNNVAMQFSDFAAQFGAPYTPAALTVTSDSNITLTLGGTPATSLLEAVSLSVAWSGLLPLTRGGTNANLTASNGGIVWSNATQLQILAGTTTANQVLLSGASSTPSWSLATYPSSTIANQLLYSSSNNVITGLATGNNGVLITSVSGVPSISSTLPLAVQLNITELGTITTGVWNGSIIGLQYGGTNANLTASNGGIVWSNASQLQILSGTATANQILMSGSSSTPAWSTAVYPATTTVNQLLYSSSSNTITGLTTGNNGVLITSALGVPSISSTLPIAVQTNITELGTITVGSWNASLIPMAYGGTNANLTATANNLVYSTSSAMALLPTANNGVLVTSNLGVPSISSTLPNAVQGNITIVGTIGSGIWQGSVIGSQWGGTGVNNGANTITIGGNLNFANSFTTVGNFAVTQTYTGITNVTFPTSGTLLTTTGITINGTANQIAVSGSSPTFTLSFPTTLYSSHNILDDGTGGMQISSTATNPGASGGALSFSGCSFSIGRSTTPLSGFAAELNFGSAYAQRMICINDTGTPGTDNQYQYYGFGHTANTLYYSIGSTTASHKFYAASSSTTSNLLFAISGNGAVQSANNFLDDGSSNATISGTLDVGNDCTFNGTNFNFGSGLSGSAARLLINAAAGTPADEGSILFVKKGTTPTTLGDSLGEIVFLGVDTAGASVQGSKIVSTATANASTTFIENQYSFHFINPSGVDVAPIQMNYQGIVLNGSSFTLSGGTSVNFNFLGATNVTFPTSGTLATVAGTVSAVQGTANQIDVSTSSGIATVSIDTNYAGQPSITTVGTVTSGTWHGTIIDSSHGGTGLGVPSPGYMLVGSASAGAWAFLTAPSAEQVLCTDPLGGIIWDSSLPTFVQLNITSVGTISAGTWNGSFISPVYGGTGVANASGSTITLGGALTFTGLFTFTGNLTGNTSVTFPTSGTLVTTAVTTLPSLVITESQVTNLTSDLNSKLNLSGGTMTGNLILNADPTAALGAVTKQYADAISAGLDIKAACFTASTAALTVTYNNGTSGVGATLTNAGTQAVFAIDGQTPPVNSRILIKDQSSTFQNGIYTVTNVGSVSTNWVLTRATDYDQTSEIQPGNLLVVDNGTTNGGTGWLQTATVTTIGTSAITFSPFNLMQVGTGLTRSGNTISLSTPVSAVNGGTGVSNGTNTITLGGNIVTANSFTTSGNFAVTQTYTGITNVTFPTSGTLVNTGVTTLSSLVITESQVTNLTTDLASKLNLSGGTMTGNLILNANATNALQAVPLQQMTTAANSVNFVAATFCGGF